jgi:orotidine-5'-phosphate decarboxylase
VTGSFASRFAAVRAAAGPLVWGLDPSGPLLEQWGLGDTPDGLDRFADIVLQAAVGTIGLVKPQSAFYERHGWRGIRTLARLTEQARSSGLLVIMDVKRGDVGSTNDAYAQAYLGKDAALAADAITVHPYLGLGAMNAFISLAHDADGCVLVVARSSNPEGCLIQTAVTSSGQPVETALLSEIGQLNATLAPGELGPVGAVVGASQPASHGPALDLAGMNGLFLAPGVGAQGATSRDVAQVFAACPDRVMPSASRSLLAAGPDLSRLRDAVGALAAEFRDALCG